MVGAIVAGLLNSRTLARARHAVFSCLPFLKMESEVSDVVYLTWLVNAERAQALVQPGVRLWQHEGKSLFTVLTYKHGNFGPALAGPLRKLFPSPMQSNWRFYLANETHRGPAVWFVKNIMDSLPYAFGTRMFSDIMQTHLAESIEVRRSANGMQVAIGGGEGSAPSLHARPAFATGRRLPPAFECALGDWDQAVQFLVTQHVAIGYAERLDALAVAGIELPIDVAQVEPLDVADGGAHCSLLDLFPDAEGPFAFLVPQVKFAVVSEEIQAL